MTESNPRPGISHAMGGLRAHILKGEAGAFLGNEDALMALLGTSRGTVRQIARILEREGLLQVRRGATGGYYAAKPDLGAIEAAVSGYLHTLDVKSDDATMIASVLWIETMRKAAQAPPDERQGIADKFTARLTGLKPETSFDAILDFEFDYRDAIFELVGSRYVQLIFQINATFAHDTYNARPELSEAEHLEFVRAWRNAKHLELAAMAIGDPDLAATAAGRARGIWHGRFAILDRASGTSA
jgi:DNA-binding FadR family transcriptional regulator